MGRVWKLSETLPMGRVWKLSETLPMGRVWKLSQVLIESLSNPKITS
ncbi:hypothetical protein LEP1GSC163_2809 [Leptospira santarosai str. CBC379]|nr:hypothetical protein [Leptospira santarosai]EKR91708.1 hypothetical protein LEP1GSC163_2809 [Leptospira santarosai str. CBC379]